MLMMTRNVLPQQSAPAMSRSYTLAICKATSLSAQTPIHYLIRSATLFSHVSWYFN